MSFFYSADPVRDAERHAEEQDRQLERCPKCAHCHYEIQDERLVNIDGYLYHFDCIDEAFGEWTGDHME